MKKQSDDLRFETTLEGDLIINLGAGEMAWMTGILMIALFGGYSRKKEDGSYIYFNEACDEDLYKHLYDKAVS